MLLNKVKPRKGISFLIAMGITLIAGNLLSYVLLHLQMKKEMRIMEAHFTAQLERIEKLHVAVQQKATHEELAQQESARLQQIMEYHQDLMARVKATPSATSTSSSASDPQTE